MLRLTTLLRETREHDEGFSIVEVLVAMTVFAMIAAGVATGIVSSLYLAHGSRSREVAIGLAQDAIDAARTNTNLFGVVDQTSTKTWKGVDYTVKQVARWVSASGSANACGGVAGGGGALAYKRVSMTVSWTAGSRGSAQSVSMNSMVAPSTSVTAANLGTIIISVSTASGAGNQGVSVSIAPNAANPAGATAITSTVPQTDSTGCSYALNVKPGRYDVTLNKSTSIDDGTSGGSLGDQTTAPSTTVTVTANQTSAVNFNYDTVLPLTPQWVDPNSPNSTFTSPTAVPITLRHKTADYGPFVANTATKVFPFTDGYQVIAGTPSTCLSTDPEAWTTANGTAVAARNLPQPNSSSPIVKAPVQIVTVKLAGKADNTLTATTASPTAKSGDPGCASSTMYTFTGLPTGGTATIGLPYGTYTLRSGTTVLGIISFASGTPTATTAPGVTTNANKVMLDPRRAP